MLFEFFSSELNLKEKGMKKIVYVIIKQLYNIMIVYIKCLFLDCYYDFFFFFNSFIYKCYNDSKLKKEICK